LQLKRRCKITEDSNTAYAELIHPPSYHSLLLDSTKLILPSEKTCHIWIKRRYKSAEQAAPVHKKLNNYRNKRTSICITQCVTERPGM